jgi:hypothetical protein
MSAAGRKRIAAARTMGEDQGSEKVIFIGYEADPST